MLLCFQVIIACMHQPSGGSVRLQGAWLLWNWWPLLGTCRCQSIGWKALQAFKLDLFSLCSCLWHVDGYANCRNWLRSKSWAILRPWDFGSAGKHRPNPSDVRLPQNGLWVMDVEPLLLPVVRSGGGMFGGLLLVVGETCLSVACLVFFLTRISCSSELFSWWWLFRQVVKVVSSQFFCHPGSPRVVARDHEVLQGGAPFERRGAAAQPTL